MLTCDERVRWHLRVHARERYGRRVSQAGAHGNERRAVRHQVKRLSGSDERQRRWSRAARRRSRRTPLRRNVEAASRKQSFEEDCVVRPPRKHGVSQWCHNRTRNVRGRQQCRPAGRTGQRRGGGHAETSEQSQERDRRSARREVKRRQRR
eukprot:4242831-Pleurochrysis_carterae.AAC.1